MGNKKQGPQQNHRAASTAPLGFNLGFPQRLKNAEPQKAPSWAPESLRAKRQIHPLVKSCLNSSKLNLFTGGAHAAGWPGGLWGCAQSRDSLRVRTGVSLGARAAAAAAGPRDGARGRPPFASRAGGTQGQQSFTATKLSKPTSLLRVLAPLAAVFAHGARGHKAALCWAKTIFPLAAPKFSPELEFWAVKETT